MPNNSNSASVANGSSFYSGGSPKWNPKFKLPNNNKNIGNPENDYDSNMIDSLVCSNVVLSLSNKNVTISKNKKIFTFEFDKLNSMELNSNILTIKTVDRTPFILIFVTENECISAEHKIYAAINQGKDIGCS